MTIRKIVATNIRQIAEARGVGLNQLADLAGVSRSQIYSVLARDNAASVDWLSRIADALDVPTWKLLQEGAGR